MNINCSQFEGLITFYIDGELSDNLKKGFEEHLDACPHCKVKYKVICSIISDIKGAYNKYLHNEHEDCIKIETPSEVSAEGNNITETELSAYIDNELPDEYNVKIRKGIISKPKIRTKLEKLYKLKKIMSDSFNEEKTRLKTDFSKDIVKKISNTHADREVYLHCMLFILVVISAVVLSIWAVFNLI